MKHLCLFIICLLATCTLHAQTDGATQHRQWNDAFMQVQQDSLDSDSLSLAGKVANSRLPLPWNVPVLSMGAYGLGGILPNGYDPSWRLHEGFNAQFGLSLTAGLGKHAPKGVGFGQSAAFAYVVPLSKRLSVAAGITATNFDWGMWRMTNVGVGGVLAYQLSDRINLYAFGQKSFLPRATTFQQQRKLHFPVFFDQPTSSFGAAAEFKIGNNAMIGVSVERREY